MTRPSGKTISVSGPAITNIMWRARDSGAEMADSAAAVNLMVVNGHCGTSRSVSGSQFGGNNGGLLNGTPCPATFLDRPSLWPNYRLSAVAVPTIPQFGHAATRSVLTP